MTNDYKINRITGVKMYATCTNGKSIEMDFDLCNFDNSNVRASVTRDNLAHSTMTLEFPFKQAVFREVKRRVEDNIDTSSEQLDEFLGQFTAKEEM